MATPHKRKTKYASALLCIALLFCFGLSGCTEAPDVVKDGITVEESARSPYSDETLLRSRAAIYSVLLGHFRAKEGRMPYASEEAILSSDADRLLALTTETLIKESDYLSYVSLLEEKKDDIIIVNLSGRGDKDLNTILDQ